MNRHEAAQAVAVLFTADRFPWPDERVETWTNSLVGSSEPLLALRTSEAMVRGVEPAEWTIPRWMQMYRALAGPPKENPHEPCARCDGTGWESDSQPNQFGGTDSCVRPCDCSRGKDRKDLHARTRETNAS